MAEILSQEEIDALREAVQSGDALDGAATAEQAQPNEIKVAAYNFRKPQIVSVEQIHELQIIHDSIAKGLQASLTSTLKRELEIKLVALDQGTYGDFVMTLSNPGCLTRLATSPDIGNAGMEVSLSIVKVVVDLLLGGSGAPASEAEDPTPLERDIFNGATDLLLAELSEGWASVMNVAFSAAAEECNPEYLQLARPEASCLSATFDVHIGETSGIMNLCYPLELLESLLKKVEDRFDSRRGGGGGEKMAGEAAMLNALGDVGLPLSTIIGGSTISARQLGLLHCGDVIMLDRRVDEALEVYIGSSLAYTGEMGQRRGKAAVNLTEPCGEEKS